MATPTGKGRELDAFNDQLRANPEYRSFLASIGVNPDAAVHLSGQQRSSVEGWLRQRVPELAGKFQIDPAGNVNTDHGMSTAWTNPWFRAGLIGAAAAGTMGAAGVFGGAAGGAGAAGGGAAAAAGGAAASGVGAGTGAALAAGAGGGLWGSIGRFAGSAAGQQLIGAAGQIINGRVQAGANDRAAEAQERSAREALDFEKKVYDDEVRDFEPYKAAGASSIARLSDMAGQSRAPVTADSLMASGHLDRPSYQAPQPIDYSQSPGNASARLSDMLNRRPAPSPSPDTYGTYRSDVPPPMRPAGQPGGAPNQGPSRQAPPQQAPPPQQQMVTLQSPDGESRQFAANDPRVPRLLQAGARKVA